jgi:hypothetical protein
VGAVSAPAGRPATRRAWLLTLLVASASVVPFWTCAVVPTQDGASHLYNAWLLLHRDDPALQASRFFRVNPFVPNWGGVGPLALLLIVAPPTVAEKLFFSLIALLVVLGAAALTARLGGDPVLGSAVAVSIAHGWLVAMGFTGFVVALGLGLCLGAWAVGRYATASPSGELPTALFLTTVFIVLFFLHLAAAVLAAGLAALILLATRAGQLRQPKRLLLPGLPFVALALLLAAHYVGSLDRTQPTYRPDTRGALGRLLELPTGTYWESYSTADDGLGTAAFVLVLGLVLARATGRGPASPPARAFLLAAPAVLVAYLLVPFAAGGGAFLTDRLVPLLLLLPLPWATSAGLPRRQALRAGALLLAAAVLGQRGAQYRHWGRTVESLVELNRGVAPGAFVVQAARIDPDDVGVDPLCHLWGRVAIEARAVPLVDYEATLRGWFPLSYTAEAQALSIAWTSRGEMPSGAVEIRYR